MIFYLLLSGHPKGLQLSYPFTYIPWPKINVFISNWATANFPWSFRILAHHRWKGFSVWIQSKDADQRSTSSDTDLTYIIPLCTRGLSIGRTLHLHTMPFIWAGMAWHGHQPSGWGNGMETKSSLKIYGAFEGLFSKKILLDRLLGSSKEISFISTGSESDRMVWILFVAWLLLPCPEGLSNILHTSPLYSITQTISTLLFEGKL